MKHLFVLTLLLLLFCNVYSQNVGVNTPNPNTSLDVNGALALRGTAITLANGDNSNVVLSEHSFFRITGPTAAFAITGIGGGVDGKIVTLFNSTNFAFTIKNVSAGSASSNQIKTLDGSDLVFFAGNSSVTLQYNTAELKWIMISYQGIEFLNQSANSTFGSGPLTVTPTTSTQTIIPGLTQTITVPQNSVVYISTEGSLTTTSVTTTGFSIVDVFLKVDDVILPNGGYQRVFAANTGGITGVQSPWSLSAAMTLAAGSHTFSVAVVGVNSAGASNATVSGNNTSPMQGTLTVMVLKK